MDAVVSVSGQRHWSMWVVAAVVVLLFLQFVSSPTSYSWASMGRWALKVALPALVGSTLPPIAGALFSGRLGYATIQIVYLNHFAYAFVIHCYSFKTFF